MDKALFDNFKIEFKQLTGKNADDDLVAFFSYLQLLNQFDIKDYLKTIINKLP